LRVATLAPKVVPDGEPLSERSSLRDPLPDPQIPSHVRRLDELLDTLAEAPADAASAPQNELFVLAERLLADDAGLRALYDRAHRFDEVRLFAGGPWDDPSKLQVPLVAGTLRAPGITPIVESLSELRLLAIASGRAQSDAMTAEEAGTFLDEVMARNLRYLFPTAGATEAEREDRFAESHGRLFGLIADERGLDHVLSEVVSEIGQILAQRPVSVWALRRMIDRALRLAEQAQLEGAAAAALERFGDAARGPSPLGREHPEVEAYRRAIAAADPDTRREEAESFAASMIDTGIVAPLHAVLIRHLRQADPDLLAVALGLGPAGQVELEANRELVHELIEASVFATTAQCLDGLRLALDRTLLSRTEVNAGVERLVGLPIHDQLAEDLLARRAEDDDVTADAVLLAGTLAVLGRPLGVGQGRNPTCQAARGISLWAQHDPAHLLELIVSVARDGWLELRHRGQILRSDQLPTGIAAAIDLDLDPVSIALVPHLDRLYSELMRRSALGLEDAHKWVNPALYGQWVGNELASCFADVAQTTIADYEAFLRCFFATHHPDYDAGHRLMYPNPVGLVITNHHGRYLGPHAVSIQRIDTDRDGQTRVYFFNPNNEGRQDWGQGVVTTVSGHDELAGESSLPFDDFASRVYAFHYNPSEEGDPAAVPRERLQAIVEAARHSWGERFLWLGMPPAPGPGRRAA